MKTTIHLSLLYSDILIYALAIIGGVSCCYLGRYTHFRDQCQRIFQNRWGMIAFVILSFYGWIGLLDSAHFKVVSHTLGAESVEVISALDYALGSLRYQSEKSYSAPFALHAYSKSMEGVDAGGERRVYARLKYGGRHLSQVNERPYDIVKRIFKGVLIGSFLWLGIFSLWVVILLRKSRVSFSDKVESIFKGNETVAWREAMLTALVVMIFVAILLQCSSSYHVLGTDKIGQDVFYESIKSIRTGLLIGVLSTLFMLPFALFLGMFSGYFGGWVDDVIQYLYTTLSSIPGVLLISAVILVLQIYINSHAAFFPTLMQRADIRLLALCFILGITGWANLCRLLRGETLKLREQEFVQAAKVLGVRPFQIIWRHIMPNVMPIVLITWVLDFSGLVLAEAVLSYVGVGVDPTTMSWGNMINSSRLELAREPVVWWPLLAALIFMFLLVLSENLFSDAVRDALDPRLRHVKD